MARFNGAATSQSRKLRMMHGRTQGQTASMGPRPLSHGNQTVRLSGTASLNRFNGAATSQSRKRDAGAGRVVGLGASMGPRPLSHGNRTTPTNRVMMMALQWGRDLSVTETGIRPGGVGVLPGASMGPRPLSHGNHPGASRVRRLEPRFNGAATSQSRKLDGGLIGVSVDWVLQWGRDLSVTETRGKRIIILGGYEASMGPRPLSHGNHDDGGLVDVPAAASMGPRPLSHGNALVEGRLVWSEQTLQWGRDLSVTETLQDLSPTARHVLASMGPRPLSHGNHRAIKQSRKV